MEHSCHPGKRFFLSRRGTSGPPGDRAHGLEGHGPNAGAGRVDADLGGGVIKQRIARKGGGKSGGVRAILLFRRGSHVFFVFGFPKSERANISKDELAAFRKLADILLTRDPRVEVRRRGGRRDRGERQ